MSSMLTRVTAGGAVGQLFKTNKDTPAPAVAAPSPTIAAPPVPAPLGEAKIGLTADDPRRRLQSAGQAPTILGTKLG